MVNTHIFDLIDNGVYVVYALYSSVSQPNLSGKPVLESLSDILKHGPEKKIKNVEKNKL